MAVGEGETTMCNNQSRSICRVAAGAVLTLLIAFTLHVSAAQGQTATPTPGPND